MTDFQELLNLCEQWATDVERHARQESAQGHLSPTDMAFLNRLSLFLRHSIPNHLQQAQAGPHGPNGPLQERDRSRS